MRVKRDGGCNRHPVRAVMPPNEQDRCHCIRVAWLLPSLRRRARSRGGPLEKMARLLTALSRLAPIGLAAMLSCLLWACAQLPEPVAQPVVIPVFPPPPDPPRFIYERTLHSSADVVPDDKDASLRRLLTGETRVGEALSKPYAVAARQGRVYVGDTVERLVAVFDLAQRRYARIGV